MRVPELIAATCVNLGFRVPGRRSSKVAAFGLDVTFAARGGDPNFQSERRNARLARPANQCPLYPQNGTLRSATSMSALCQKQTFTGILDYLVRATTVL